MTVERLLFIMAAIILSLFIFKLIWISGENVIPIFATIAWGVAILGTFDYDSD